MTKKIITLVSGLTFTVLIILGWWYFFSLPREFAVVDSEVLYRSGQGSPHQIQNAIRQFKIKTIICFRELEAGKDASWLSGEQAVAKRNQVSFVHWPTDSHKSPSEKSIVEFLRMTQDPSKYPILIHCAQGKHRTGFYSAVYRMVINGWSFGKAIKEMDGFKFGLDSHTELMDGLRTLDPAKVRQTNGFKTHEERTTRDLLGQLLTVSLWTIFGFTGQFFFFSRFLVQWIASEKNGRTTVPVAFWYLSLLGGAVLTVYAIGRSDIVITLGQGLGCFIYVRNLMIIKRHRENTQGAVQDGG